MLISDFKEEFPEFVENGDLRGASNSIIGELGNVLAKNKKDFVDLLNESDINAYYDEPESELINKYIINLGTNNKLNLGSALLVYVYNRESGIDGEQVINDEGVKCAYGVINSYFNGEDESNAVGAIAGAVGGIANLGSTIAQGQQRKKYGALDLATKKQEARSVLAQKVLDVKKAELEAQKGKQGSMSKNTKTILIVGGAILGIAIIGGIIYALKKGK